MKTKTSEILKDGDQCTIVEGTQKLFLLHRLHRLLNHLLPIIIKG